MNVATPVTHFYNFSLGTDAGSNRTMPGTLNKPFQEHLTAPLTHSGRWRCTESGNSGRQVNDSHRVSTQNPVFFAHCFEDNEGGERWLPGIQG